MLFAFFAEIMRLFFLNNSTCVQRLLLNMQRSPVLAQKIQPAKDKYSMQLFCKT
jgi:hypothetical protein